MNKIFTSMGVALSLATVAPHVAKAEEYLSLATLGPGSTPYMVMSTFAQMVNDNVPDVEIQVNATGAATAHALQAAENELNFFMMAPIVQQFMSAGTGMYKDIPEAPELSKNLRGLFIFPLGDYHILTYADSGIETLKDIKGKKVFVGPPGGSATQTMQTLIESATGYKADVDYTPVIVGWDSGAQSFADGRIDVYANPTLAPSPAIQQLIVSKDARLIGLTPEELEAEGVKGLTTRAGGLLATIDPTVYGAHMLTTDPVTTVGSYGGIGTNKWLNDETAYQVTKAFWEQAEAQRETTPWLRNVTLDTAFTDLNMPLHPGAIRYYEEIGIEIPDELRPSE